jgi:hypothetical protein
MLSMRRAYRRLHEATATSTWIEANPVVGLCAHRLASVDCLDYEQACAMAEDMVSWCMFQV